MLVKAVRLSTTTGILMMIAGCIFGVVGLWIYAALVWSGAFCSCIAALNFKSQKNKETSNLCGYSAEVSEKKNMAQDNHGSI